MSIDIYFFSGTGNSLYVAKEITESTGGNLIPVASMVREKTIKSNAEVIGIVFPVYYADIPNIIAVFARKLINIDSKYVFIVCTYGGGKGRSIQHLKSLMVRKKISAIYGIHMPQNTFYKFWENQNQLNKASIKMIELICRNIQEKRKGFFTSNILIDLLQRPLFPFLQPIFLNGLVKLSGCQREKSIKDLIPFVDNSFTTNKRCNSCGICVKVCPVQNIKLVDKRPKWLNKCENCLACYNFCPERAIETGLVSKHFYYKHPEISLSEFIRLNNPHLGNNK